MKKILMIAAIVGLIITAFAYDKNIDTVFAPDDLVKVISIETGEIVLGSVRKSDVGKELFLKGFEGEYILFPAKSALPRLKQKREVLMIK